MAQDVNGKAAVNIHPVGLLVGGGGHALLVLHPVGGILHHLFKRQRNRPPCSNSGCEPCGDKNVAYTALLTVEPPLSGLPLLAALHGH